MKLQIEIAGKKRQVELTHAGERPVWTIDGQRLEADAVTLAPGIYSILINGKSFDVRVESLGAELRAITGGREFKLGSRTNANGDAIVVAPSKQKAFSESWRRCQEKSCVCL